MILFALACLFVGTLAALRWLRSPRRCLDCGRPWEDRIHLPCAVIATQCKLGHHPYVGYDAGLWGWLAVAGWTAAWVLFWWAI